MEPFRTPIKLRVTIAKKSDRPLITDLCRRAVGKSDYVLRMLPTIISRGTLFLAWKEDRLVGMTNFGRCIDGSGWLSVARTDPDWRGRGVATYLQRKIAAFAQRQGVRTLRMWVSSENKPSRRACERGGFKQVAEATHIFRNLSPTKLHRKPNRRPPSESHLLGLLKSSYVAKTRGYIGYRWHFVKLTMGLLTRLDREGELYLIEDAAFLISRPETIFGFPQSSLALLEGPFANSLNLARDAARGMGAQILTSYIPYSRYEISVARRLGFNRSVWGKHCLVFEKTT